MTNQNSPRKRASFSLNCRRIPFKHANYRLSNAHLFCRFLELAKVTPYSSEWPPMPSMRYELPTAYLRSMRDARAHGFGDHAHRYALQLRQNIAPEVQAFE